MSMFPHRSRRQCFHPIDRYAHDVYGDFVRAFDRSARFVEPYWLDQPLLQECNIGNAVGKTIDTDDRFEVEVNVAQFKPEELTVNVRDKELVIEGHHEERSDHNGTIERHFIRKYSIPEGAQIDTLESYLSDQGVLSVSAKKSAPGLAPSRIIPIKAAPREAKRME